jgi:uncharacterized protein (DUF952 family)
MMDFIFHITTRTSWSTAKKSGGYNADSLMKEGFIHCSKTNQILRVAYTYYANQRGLVLLEIDASKLKPEVRWEPGTDKQDELFPHIYGPLNLEAVVQVINFEIGKDGRFSLPIELS